MKRLVLALVFALAASADERAAAKYFDGVTLVDHTGRTVDFYKDLMADRTVVINSFFATCTGSCPIMANNLAAVQSLFADRIGKELVLISITVDPLTDTPAKLRDYAKRVGAKSGWYFLTGTKEQVDLALKRIGQASSQPEDHVNIFVIGNDRTGLWKKALGLAKGDEIAAIVKSVLEDQVTTIKE